jgi:hypothetical protein
VLLKQQDKKNREQKGNQGNEGGKNRNRRKVTPRRQEKKRETYITMKVISRGADFR